MNYITEDELFNLFENSYSYLVDRQNSTVDRTILFPKMAQMMQMLGNKSRVIKECITQVNNCSAELPSDFHKACVILGCFSQDYQALDRYDETIHTSEENICSIGKCDSLCNYHQDCDGGHYRIIMKHHGQGVFNTYKRYVNLRPSRETYNVLHPSSLNNKSQSEHIVDIRNGKINTNFEDGYIFLKYESVGEQFDIVDNPQIIQWMIKELALVVMRHLYYSGEADYQQRIRSLVQETEVERLNALKYIKTSERSDFYSVSNELIRRYNSLRSWDSAYYNSSNLRNRWGILPTNITY